MIQLLPFPVLETKRLILRNLKETDAEDIFIMRSDPEVMRYIPRPIAVTSADALALIQLVHEFIAKEEKINWAIESKESGQVIGMIGFVNLKREHFRAEIGYSLMRSWHRKGVMTEALLRVLQHGFEGFNLHSIEAITDAENVASGKLLESVGFRKEAYFKEDFLFNGKYRDSIHYGMLRSEAIIKNICN